VHLTEPAGHFLDFDKPLEWIKDFRAIKLFIKLQTEKICRNCRRKYAAKPINNIRPQTRTLWFGTVACRLDENKFTFFNSVRFLAIENNHLILKLVVDRNPNRRSS